MESTVMGLILLMLLGIGQATPPYRSLPGHRYKEQFCEDAYSGRQLYIGEVITRTGQCIRVQCLGTLQLWEDSCKTPVGLKGNCVVLPATEPNLDYPHCCPMYECKKYENNVRGEMEETNTYDHRGNLRNAIVITRGSAVIPHATPRKDQV